MGQGYIAQYGNDPTNGQHYWIKGEKRMFEYDYHTTFNRDFSSMSCWSSQYYTTTHYIHNHVIEITTYRTGSDDMFYLTIALDGKNVLDTGNVYLEWLQKTFYSTDFSIVPGWCLIHCDFRNNRVLFIEFDNEFLYYYNTPQILISTDPNAYIENDVPASSASGDYIKKVF